MPMQVVLPSVSRADLLQGTAVTVSVEIPSSAVRDIPTVVPGFWGLPTTGADPVIGTLEGGAATDGGDATASPVVLVVGACCCAHADDDNRTSVAAITILRIMRLLASKATNPGSPPVDLP
jgi:hypothetical protein